MSLTTIALIKALIELAVQAPAYVAQIMSTVNAIKADLAEEDLPELEAELAALRARMPEKMAEVDAALDAAALR